MFLILKKKYFILNFFYKRFSYYGIEINFNYSFLFFFVKNFYIFNNIFYFNNFFLSYLKRLILILKVLLINKCNFLILIKLKKKNNYKNLFFKKFFLYNISLFHSFKLIKVFDSYKYLINWLFFKNFFFLKYPKYSLIIVYNFTLKLDFLKSINLFNIPVISFDFYSKKNKEFYDFFFLKDNFKVKL